MGAIAWETRKFWFCFVFNQLLFLLCSLEFLYLETPFSVWRKVLLLLVLWCKALVWHGRAKSGRVLCAQGQIGLSNDLCIKRTTSSVWRDEKTNTESDTLCLRCFSVVNSCRFHITHDVCMFLFTFMWICFHELELSVSNLGKKFILVTHTCMRKIVSFFYIKSSFICA